MIGRVNTGKPFIRGMDIDGSSKLCLCLPLEDYDGSQAARRLIRDVSTKKLERLTVTVDKLKKPRSLDANAYCFALIDKIAAATGAPKEEIYREAIKDIGGVSDVVCVKNKAVESLCAGWQRTGIGWQTDTFPSKIEGCTNVILYYGSSSYDTYQMSRLIDHIVQDCRTLGIETLTDKELTLLKGEWNK